MGWLFVFLCFTLVEVRLGKIGYRVAPQNKYKPVIGSAGVRCKDENFDLFFISQNKEGASVFASHYNVTSNG